MEARWAIGSTLDKYCRGPSANASGGSEHGVGSNGVQNKGLRRQNAQNGKIQAGCRYPNNSEVTERLTDMGNKTDTTAIYTAKDDDNERKGKTTRKAKMLVHPEVKRWYDNLARGSKLTADVRLRRLDKFCEIHGMTPMQLADLGTRDIRTATNLLEDHITQMEDNNYSPGYINDYVKAIKSWLVHFDVVISRKLKVKNPDETPTLQNERVPNAQEISEVFARASLRTSAMIALMSKSGIRPEVMGNHDGTDGLRMSDLPDVVIHQGVAKCIRTPNQIVVRRTLSKTRHQYFTFLTASGTKMLLAYLNDRLAAGEPLHGDSAVIAPDHKYKTDRGSNGNKTFLPTQRISKEIRRVFRPRFQWRPYILRAYFDTELLVAESKGRMVHDFRVFFMGHKGSMESKYTTNKGMLPEVLLQEMRDAFTRSEKFLDLEDTAAGRDPVLEQKQEIHHMIRKATPEQMGLMLEALRTMQGAGNMTGLVHTLSN